MTIAAWVTLPDGTSIHWVALLLLTASIPLTSLTNAAEYVVIARVSGQRVGYSSALRVTLIATAANLLPLPGALAIRTQALRSKGVSYNRALAASGAAGGAWLGVTLAAVGLLAQVAGHGYWAAGLIGAAVACFTATAAILRRTNQNVWALLASLLCVETFAVALDALRVALAFATLGTAVTLLQSVALTLPIVLASLIGIFPAGLGVREALAGLIGGLVALPLSASVAATALDRLCAQAVLTVMTGLVLLSERRRSE